MHFSSGAYTCILPRATLPVVTICHFVTCLPPAFLRLHTLPTFAYHLLPLPRFLTIAMRFTYHSVPPYFQLSFYRHTLCTFAFRSHYCLLTVPCLITGTLPYIPPTTGLVRRSYYSYMAYLAVCAILVGLLMPATILVLFSYQFSMPLLSICVPT